ncbi:MAG: septation protein SpoVG family protein [bacterium]
MKIARMNPLKNSSTKTAAFFDIQTEEEILIKGFKLVNGTNGLFVSSPDEKRKDGKYYETVTLPKELKDKLQKTAIEEYNKVKE